MAQTSYKLKWQISNVNSDTIIIQGKKEEPFKSENFKIIIGNNVTEWSLGFEFDDSVPKSIAVYLYLIKADRLNFKVELSCNIENKYEEKLDELTEPEIFKYGWGFEMASMENILKMLKDDELNLDFYIMLTEETNICQGIAAEHRIENFVHNEEFGDFVFTCSDNVSIRVHRFNLASKSKVFRDIFNSSFEEIKKREIQIDDVDSTTMKEVLCYIYTGKTQLKGFTLAYNVLHSAHLFQLDELKQFCIQELVEETSKENVFDAFNIAEQHVIYELEQKCLSIIQKHYFELKETSYWKLLTVPILNKIIDAFAQAKMPKCIINSSLPNR